MADVTKQIWLLESVEAATNAAISANDMDRMMVLGKMYHSLAEEIFEATGVDPRPYDEVFHPAKGS